MSYIVIASMLVALTAVAVFVPRIPAVLCGYAAMWVCKAGGVSWFGTDSLIFWGVATAIALGITYLIPRQVAYSSVGVPFMAGGALAGTVLGMLSNTMAGIIAGAVAGALFGGIAFANTPAGRKVMRFPSAPFFNYLAAKGLPMAVALSMGAACAVQWLVVG